MRTCPQCDSSGANRSAEAASDCPACGRLASDAVEADWVDVARVANLAEASFICDELNGADIEARLHHLDDFDAATHRSSSNYLIRVPSHLATPAARHIGQYLSEEQSSEPTFLERFRSVVGAKDEPISWRPVLVVVLASLASFSIGQRLSSRRLDSRPSPNSLPSRIGAIGRPLTTEPAANQPRFRLSYDQRQQGWTLDADQDNDGRFEKTMQFRSDGAPR